jgi:hypothetical protein
MKALIGKTLADLRKEGYEGSDGSLDISLKEYGVICKANQDGSLDCVYKYNEENGFFLLETYQGLTASDFDWIDVNAIVRWDDETVDKWNSYPLQNRLFDALNYYGAEEIFGTVYFSPKIKIGVESDQDTIVAHDWQEEPE